MCLVFVMMVLISANKLISYSLKKPSKWSLQIVPFPKGGGLGEESIPNFKGREE